MSERAISPIEYLDTLGKLYTQATTSGEDPDLLRSFGGVFAIAANDAQRIRVEENAYLRIIDRSRDQPERVQLARQRWSVHRHAMAERLRQGVSPKQVFEDYMAHYGTVPHSPENAYSLAQLEIGTSGTHPQWQYGVVELRARYDRGAAVMGDTFGAITATVTLFATAKDWKNPTVDEWETAFKAGEVGAAAGQIAGAWAQGQDLQRAGQAAVQAAHVPSANVVAVASKDSRVVARATPTPAQRGVTPTGTSTTAATSTPAQRGLPVVRPASKPTAKAPSPSPQRASRVVIAPELDADVEHALAEHAPRQLGPRTEIGPKTHRKGALAGQKFHPLDAVAARLSKLQLRNAQHLMARFPPNFRAAWESRTNPKETADLRKVQSLWRQGKTAEAKELARSVFNNKRDRFWGVIRGTQLEKQLRDAGLEFGARPDTAPFWSLPDGTKEVLSVEHGARVSDAPWRSTESGHLMFSPERENTAHLESIRNKDRFQQ